MKEKRKKSYWQLLLAGALVAGAVVCATGTAQARYTTVAGWQLQIQQPKTQLELVSSVMAANGSTVVLEDLSVDDTKELTVDMQVIGGTANGRLICTSSEYLVATCENSIADETEKDFTIVLTPTDAAKALESPTMTEVTVKWDDSFYATLQVTLLPTQEEEMSNSPTSEEESISLILEEEISTTLEGDILTGMTSFDPNEYLALEVTVPEGDSVKLTLGEENFPAFTRYSTDGGENFILLYDGGAINLTQSGMLLLDFEDAFEDAVISSASMTITAMATSGETDSITTQPSEALAQLDSQDAPIIVTAESDWVCELPEGLTGNEVAVSLKRLDETTEELPVVTIDNGQLQISSAQGTARAGTYILDITWNYQNVPVATRRLTFYVNYSAYVQTDESSVNTTAMGDDV